MIRSGVGTLLAFLAVAAMSSAEVSPVTAAGARPSFAISLKNGVVSPARLEVPANTVVSVTVRNVGKSTAEFESRRLHIEKILLPGAKAMLTLRGLAPGKYEFVDEFTEDRATAHGFIVAK